MNKLGYTEKEVGHMSYRKWDDLYTAYKNNFDLETQMFHKGVLYKDLITKKEEKEEIVPF